MNHIFFIKTRRSLLSIAVKCLFFIAIFSCQPLFAQDEKTQLALAQQFVEQKEFDKAIPIYKSLYERSPFDKNLYDAYFDALIEAEDYEKAKELTGYMMKIRREDPVLLLDLGRIFELQKDNKSAKTQYEAAVNSIDGNDFKTQQLALAFERRGQYEYAIEVYTKAREQVRNPYMYASQLALLYSKINKPKEAIQATLDLVMVQRNILNDIKESLIQISDQDKNNFSLIQKELQKRVREQPNNPNWIELISWIHIQNKDYEGALKQLIDLDKREEELGQRIIPFAKSVQLDYQFSIAIKAYDYILNLGKEQPYYQLATLGKLETSLAAFLHDWPNSKNSLNGLIIHFDNFFEEFPIYQNQEIWRQYAMIQARYNHELDTAIAMLETSINSPRIARELQNRCKLDIGDYYILQGKIWDAALIYAQVDKDAKQDFMGEEARFKSAKLAFYRGDFKWAQDMLSVLKASTTELIANDALYLSVLITENITDEESEHSLAEFANAELLLFQNKTKESDELLENITQKYPQTPLLDDIAMLRAKIAIEESRFEDAIVFLKTIIDQFGQDVLADDAIFTLAQIYLKYLDDPENALYYFEKLIIDYPGSTFIQESRNRYNLLRTKEAL